MRNDKPNVIVNMSFDFAVETLKFCTDLAQQKQFVIVKQFGKCGTSVGANVREAQNAESKNDFIHKMKIASKEIEESLYWLELCKATGIKDDPQLYLRAKEIMLVLTKIVSSSKKNKN